MTECVTRLDTEYAVNHSVSSTFGARLSSRRFIDSERGEDYRSDSGEIESHVAGPSSKIVLHLRLCLAALGAVYGGKNIMLWKKKASFFSQLTDAVCSFTILYYFPMKLIGLQTWEQAHFIL